MVSSSMSFSPHLLPWPLRLAVLPNPEGTHSSLFCPLCTLSTKKRIKSGDEHTTLRSGHELGRWTPGVFRVKFHTAHTAGTL